MFGFGIKKKSLRLLWSSVITANLYLSKLRTKRERVIWIVGDGRSGTTWLANLINFHGKYRYMFEPFHPKNVAPMNRLQPFQYMRPESHDKYSTELANDVFTGRFQHSLVDEFNRSVIFRGLLIKDIFANLFIKWVDRNFPDFKKIMILRHPCAVALSKEKNIYGFWMKEPRDFLFQRDLLEDFLTPFKDIIKGADSFFEKQIVIWSIVHYVPLSQLERGRVHLTFYEELCTKPDREMQRIFSYLGDDQGEGPLDPRLFKEYRTPSMASLEESAINSGEDLISGWRKELTNAQIEKAIQILQLFGLDKVYNDGLMPNRDAALRMLEKS